MWNWETPTSFDSNDQIWERIIEPIEWAERLKEAWGWPILVLHGGNIGWWAAMAWELSAYIEDKDNPLPKAIVWSSVGSVLWLILRDSVKNIRPHDRTNRDRIRFDDEMREAMREALEKLYLEDLPDAATFSKSLLGLGLWAYSKAFWDNHMNLQPLYDKYWYDTLFDNKWEQHFDLIVTYSQVTWEDSMTWEAIMYANDDITTLIGDASSTFHGKDAEELPWNKLGKDGNYSNYLERLWKGIQDWEKILFLTSYSKEKENIPDNCEPLIHASLEKRLCVANEFVDSGMKYLISTANAEVTIRRSDVDEDDRWNLSLAKNIFLAARERAKSGEK